MNSLFNCGLTVGPAAQRGPAACLTSRCVTLDGAAIMLQAAHTLYDTLQWALSQTPSACETLEIQLADLTVSPCA